MWQRLVHLPRQGAWWLLRLYQLTLSPWFGRTCRFHPTCSHYGQEALLQHGFLKGSILIFWRLARCQPLGGCGIDPVPAKFSDIWKK